MPRPLDTDSARQLEHSWQYATVIALDCDQRPPVVKVKFDDNDDGEQISDWIPFMQLRAGTSFVWMPPLVGEMGIVLSAGGEMEVMKYIGASFCDQFIPDDASEDLMEIRFKNQDYFKHDSKTGILKIKASLVEVECDVVAKGISLIKHLHKGVTKGRSKTGKPV